VTFGEQNEMVFLGKDFGSEKNYSETIAFTIDQEISRLISGAVKRAKDILAKKVDTLHRIAKTLIEKETLEQQEFYALIG
jgi:cell division protease FtsH